MIQSIEIEKCPICGDNSRVIFNIYSGKTYISSMCDHEINGPQFDNEQNAILYWNAMMRGLKEEINRTKD